MMDDDDESRAHASWSGKWAGYAAGSVILAWGTTPLLRYANPELVFSTSALLAVSVIASYEVHLSAGRRAKQIALFAVLTIALVGVCYLGKWMLDDASQESSRNDARCSDIQRRMFAALPDRPDLPDLFQALGCRPQGEGSVYAPSVVHTNRDIRSLLVRPAPPPQRSNVLK